jgi:hypothetical protein
MPSAALTLLEASTIDQCIREVKKNKEEIARIRDSDLLLAPTHTDPKSDAAELSRKKRIQIREALCSRCAREIDRRLAELLALRESIRQAW